MGEKNVFHMEEPFKEREEMSWEKLALMKYLSFKHFIEHIIKIEMLGW